MTDEKTAARVQQSFFIFFQNPAGDCTAERAEVILGQRGRAAIFDAEGRCRCGYQ